MRPVSAMDFPALLGRYDFFENPAVSTQSGKSAFYQISRHSDYLWRGENP